MDYQWNASAVIVISIYSLLKCIFSFADYFTVGCKTEDGFTVILVERGPGIETKQIKTSYSATAGTAYITFDNVEVPVENTLGEEGGGIFVILR
jgi:alkylation response protein AidB-like acyl-CoA dehydrogenase